jgi:hypothetical protein
MKHSEFTCLCGWCLEDAADPKPDLARRNGLYENRCKVGGPNRKAGTMRQLVQNLDATYAREAHFRDYLHIPLLAFAEACRREGKEGEAIAASERMLSLSPRATQSAEHLVRLNIAEAQCALKHHTAVRKTLSDLLDWVSKRADLHWPDLKRLAGFAFKSGDRSGVLTPILEALHSERESKP